MSDAQLLERFERVRLQAASFDHTTHVRVAFLCLREYGLTEGQARYRDGLRRFAERAGVPGKYHETVTCALLLIIHERMTRPGPATGWEEFAAQHPDLLVWKGGPLFRHYPESILRSPEARTTFVRPEPGYAALPGLPEGADPFPAFALRSAGDPEAARPGASRTPTG